MHHIYNRVFILFFSLYFFPDISARAQCVVVTNASSYNEDFEVDNGNWVPGGTSTDWAWGKPAKATITAAGSGQFCWITGGLAKTTYNTGQRSWITSPCFDLTNVTNPFISFKVYWETETTYDGGSLQYSTNNGATWANVGAFGEAASCLNKNWFNNASINNLTQQSPKSGWSGTIKPAGGSCGGGNGSGGWLTAAHSLQNLAGNPSVKLRFTFGAGTTCNTYDGFAVDDITIGNSTSSFSAGISTKTDVTCYGGNDGSATVNVTGTGTFSYSWAPSGGTGTTATNLTAGTYTATVSDPAGCTDTAIVQILQPAIAFKVNASATRTTCGIANGTVTANVVSGGIAPYTYLWTPGNYPVKTMNNLGPGTYTITVTDSKGCTATAQATIAPSDVPFIIAMNHTDALCNGQANGTATATVINGIPPYTYNWTNGSNTYTGNPLTGVGAGTYNLSVIDSNGCADYNTVTISEPSPLSHTVNISHVSCTSSTGSATITEAGGTSTYNYSWSPSGGTGSSASGLAVGNYVVTVTDSKGCIDTVHIAILNTSTVNLVISNITPVTCNGGSDGSATVNATGSGGVTYAWSPSGGNGATAANLPADTYTVTVTDATGCSAAVSAIVNQPAPFTTSVSAIRTTCGANNGSAAVAVAGANGGYTYLWTPGSFATASITNQPAGTYTVAITDSKGCTTTAQAFIGPSNNPAIASISTTKAKCNGQPTGSASATVSGGILPYSYSWTNGATSYTGNPLQNAAAGNYQLTVTDSAGCAATGNTVITEPTALQHTASTTPSKCGKPNGSAAVTETGGTSPYTYSWSPSGGNASSASGLLPGSYVVTITDSSGCIDAAHVVVTDVGSISVSIGSISNVKCYGGSDGSATAVVSGGVPPISYSWSPTGGNDSVANNLPAGTYTVTATDVNGCTANETGKVGSALPLKISLGGDTAVCPGAVVILSPGNFPSYQWQDGSTDTTYKVVHGGTYSVVVLDSNGCNATASVRVDFDCRDIVFPGAFTPDGNGRNDLFGPLGTLSSVKDYTFRIYSRWGQVVFTSVNPSLKWDGRINGAEPGTGTYIWIAEYSFNGQAKKVQKGTVVIIR